LKLIEKGVPKEKLGLLALPLTPFEVVLPLLISRYTNGPNPLRIFTNAYPFRLVKNFSK
jgi:MFS transporter, PAT family, solute carrier family 33 (acetyl-CoA transportor), member 1